MSNSITGIAVSGKSGCGNTTTSAQLAHQLGFILVNYTFRTLATEKGMDFEEVRRLAETDDQWDKLVDSRQVEMANAHPSVLASRLAIWVWKEARLKVYLDAPFEVRARRIFLRENEKGVFKNLEEAREHTRARDEVDHRRYQALYSIDNDDWSFADLVVDATLTTEEIVGRIVERWKALK